MARKRLETGGGGSAPWLNTFADLMNLLLCFFVMLFAFSDVNKEKYEKVTISMANSFGVLQGGGSAFDNSELISSGITQLSELDQYITKMGQSSNETGADQTGQSDTSDPAETKEGNEGSQDTKEEEEYKGSSVSGDSKGNEKIGLLEAEAKINEEMASANAGMYDKVSDLTDKYNLGDSVELSMDRNNKYVLLTMNGAILYDSGEAELKKEALPILFNISKILKNFDGYHIEIVGYTDNVPMENSEFKDNNWLSSARALNAAEYLIDECGIDPEKLKYSGRGPYDPICSNATPEGRAKNRRIEIKIYNEYSSE